MNYFINFLKIYPESIYNEKIFFFCRNYLSHIATKESLDTFYKDYILKHPDYYSNYYYFFDLENIYHGDYNPLIKFLQATSEATNGSLLSKLCRVRLSQLAYIEKLYYKK